MALTTEAQQAAEAAPAGSRRLKWILGCALILGGIGGLAFWGMSSSDAVSFFVTPSELLAADSGADGRTLRLGGVVADGTLQRDGSTVRFEVTDGEANVAVVYTGEVPDTLLEGTDVVAEGTLSAGGTLEATNVMAKCSSRFEPEDMNERPQVSRDAGG